VHVRHVTLAPESNCAACATQGHTIDNFTALSAAEALQLIGKLRFRGNDKTVADDLVPEISQRLRFMQNVGLGYLALGRSAKTLSGGESQRIRWRRSSARICVAFFTFWTSRPSASSPR